MKKILIIKSHPRDDSFCHALADEYSKGAEGAGHETKAVSLTNLELERYLKYGHDQSEKISPELSEIQELVIWSDHLVFAYPTWWAVPPALLKVFLEMILLPGFAYKPHEKKELIPKWDKLLSGRMARLIVTMGAPALYYQTLLGDPGYKMMKATMGFCGIKPVFRSYFGSVNTSTPNKRKRWLVKAYKIGMKE